jgi:hypothetical protein
MTALFEQCPGCDRELGPTQYCPACETYASEWSTTTLDQWKANHPEEVARIRKWLKDGDAERADLEPRKRPDGRWQVAA